MEEDNRDLPGIEQVNQVGSFLTDALQVPSFVLLVNGCEKWKMCCWKILMQLLDLSFTYLYHSFIV